MDTIEVTEQISRFKEFFEENYMDELLERIRVGKNWLDIDFAKLSKHDIELAELLLDYPEEVLKAAEIGIKEFDLPEEIKRFHIRPFNLPESQTIMIRDIRSKHIGGLLTITGTVRQKSDVRPQVTTARFECPSCGNVMSVLQLENKFNEPTRCGCGRKGKFRLLSKELVDAQGIVLEEATEDLEGGEQPKRMNVFLKDDLVSPISDKRTNPGSKIRIVGSIKEVPIILRSGSQSTKFDLLIDANHVISVEEDFTQIQITKEEKEEIINLSNDPKVYEKLVQSITPSIYGHDKIKEALVLQLIGGVHKKRADGVSTRGDMHVLLVGDPGSGKSMMLKRCAVVAPKCKYVSGKGASGAGLTAAVVKDEFLNGWSLEAGALVLANKGFCMIDELDKMSKEDRSAMHEALEQQTVTISKANIQATLQCQTTVLAAANPKFGRFDPYELLAKQIDLPPSLLNRFDLIFPVRDMPEPEKDEALAKFVLNLHKATDIRKSEIGDNLLRKYLVYTRTKCKPQLTDDALEEIKAYYVKMRNSGTEDGGVQPIPISARQLEGLVRLSEASAKSRLATTVNRDDAKRAIELLHFCLSQIGLDPDTGKIDIDRISSGITASQRGQIGVVKEIIKDLEDKVGKVIPIDDIIKEADTQDIRESAVEEVIEKLKRSGDVFEPKRGFLSRI